MIQRLSVLLLGVLLLGCSGSAVKTDARRLKRKCDVVVGQPVSEVQARCISKLYGVKNKTRCPVEVDRPEGFREPVFRVRESCNGLGVVVAESSGEVLALVAGDEVLAGGLPRE